MQNITLTELITRATGYLCNLNYSKGSIYHYCNTWNLLKKYARKKGIVHFSLNLGLKFLSDHYGIVPDSKLPSFHTSLIRRIMALEEFKNTSRICLYHQRKSKKVPEQFTEIFKSYQKLADNLKLCPSTIQSKSFSIKKFLIFLNDKKIKNFDKLTVENIYDYCNYLKIYSSATKSAFLFTLRHFLKFLYGKKLVTKEIASAFPVIVSDKFETIPSFYTKIEINKLLGYVDRKTKIGKRDYAVLILAINLGMRSGDIMKLKFGNIKWDTNHIEYVQQKTSKFMCLPLTKNIKFALLDYMKNSRPKSKYQDIFVRHRAPFIPFSKRATFYAIINKYIAKAGIVTEGKKHGLHSMRHSLASNLLSNNTPMPVITEILGHKNSNSTNLYLRIDIESLRSIALEVPYER
jgi:integrase/recombinase XerD